MATALNVLSGNNQAAPINTAFNGGIRVVALSNGVSVQGVLIRFSTAPSGPSGYFQATGTRFSEVYTDVMGRADSGIFIANGTVGSWIGVAESVATFEYYTTFSAQNVSSPPGLQTLTLVGGLYQKQEVGKNYGPLQALCKDQYGAIMIRYQVRFSNQYYEQYGNFGGYNDSYAYTDDNGVATSGIFTASQVLGVFYVGVYAGNRNESTLWENIPARPPDVHTLIYCEA